MKGEVVWFYAFDVANEIHRERVEEVLAEKPTPFVIRRDHTTPRDVPFHQPLSVEPDLKLNVCGASARVQVRIYEVGVVSIAVRIAVERQSLAELAALHHPTLEGGQTLDQFAIELCTRVADGIAGAMKNRASPKEPEAYTVFCITDLGPEQGTESWLDANRRGVAGLLSDLPPENLSESQIAEVMRHQRTCEMTDLVVIDWDAALLIDLKEYIDDTLFVLELANIQLEEFRALDRMLDHYLDTAYEHLEKRERWKLGRSTAILRKLRWFRVDLTRLADEVTNITKFIGDWHLARVYESAKDRFHIDEWKQSVEQRLKQLDEQFTVVHSEITERRMMVLEIVVIVLILIEVLNTIFGKH
jgi:hypothetical protein